MAIPGHFVGAVLASVAEKGLEMLFKELRKKGDIARTLEYKMSEKILKLLQKTQTLEEDVKDYLETTGHKLKVLKAELNE